MGRRKEHRLETPLAGLGTSTPIVWGDRIFLTAQIDDGPHEGRAPDFENASVARRTGERDMVRFVVKAFSRRDGHPLWEYKFDADGFMQPVHIKHNMASPSCVTGGELVYAWIGTGRLVALTLDGKEVWKRHLGKEYGPFEILWGHGSPPMIYKNKLILLCDHQGQAYLLSLEKKSGKQIWES
jgi:outer membrane protein assembly factor BamB